MKHITMLAHVLAALLVHGAMADTGAPPSDQPGVEKWQPGQQLDAADLPELWVQGDPVRAFKQGTVYLIDFWQCPQPGPRSYLFHRRRPGYYGTQMLEKFGRLGKRPDNVAQLTIAVNEESTAERIRKFLDLPALRCSHPVAVDRAQGTVSTVWLAASGFKSLPHTLVVKDGRMLWSGEGSSVPESLVLEAARADFDLASYQRERKRDMELFKTMRPTLAKVDQAVKNGATPEEVEAMLAAAEKQLGHIPFCYMAIQETRFALALERKDRSGAVAVMKRTADTWPDDTFVQGRVFKYLSATEELKPESLPVIIQCMKRQAHIRGGEYASRCWLVIGKAYKDMGKTDKATEALKKAVATSDVQRRLDLLRSGAALPLAE